MAALGCHGQLMEPDPEIVAGDIRWTLVTAGGSHTCGVAESGGVYCWGEGDDGQLGEGEPWSSRIPVVVVVDPDSRSR